MCKNIKCTATEKSDASSSLKTIPLLGGIHSSEGLFWITQEVHNQL